MRKRHRGSARITLGFVGSVVIASFSLLARPAFGQILPEQPREFLDTTYAPPVGGTLWTPTDSLSFQAALNDAAPGDIIELQAGMTYEGNFFLRPKTGSGWIYIQSSALPSLPAPGTRVTPAHAGSMPKIVTPNSSSAIQADAGASFYRLVGIEVTGTLADQSYTQFNLVSLEGATDVTVDRSYVHGTTGGAYRQGVLLNGTRLAVVDSWVSDIHTSDRDSQAIIGWNGSGPFKIVNNYLEGAGENVMFGGADPSIPGLVPSDIEIRRNHFFKPLSWRAGDPSYAGIHWTVKNLFELKNAQRVLIDGNLFENCWVDPDAAFGQQGANALVLTVRNQSGGCPWCVVQDVTVTNNIARHIGQGIGFSGIEGAGARRFLIRNNLFDDVSGVRWGPLANGRLFNILNGLSDVTIDHNTGFQDGAVVYNQDAISVVYTNNITLNGGGASTEVGPNAGFAGPVPPSAYAQFAKNVVVGGGGLPPDNFTPATLDEVGFVDPAGGNYRLASTSPYKGAGTDGKDIGADIDAIDAAINGTSGLVVHLKFDEGAGTVASDSSGTGNHGQLLDGPPCPGGPTWVAGKIGGALGFDGCDDGVRVPYSASWNAGFTQYTVAFWVKVKTLADFGAAIAVGAMGSKTLIVELRNGAVTADKWGWDYGILTAGGANNWICFATAPPVSYLNPLDGAFHHLAVVLDAPAGRCDLYSDGQLISTDQYVDGQMALGDQSLYVGRTGDSNPLHSEIDDVRIYNRALSASEIQALVNTGGP